jgi:hypothetical protein
MQPSQILSRLKLETCWSSGSQAASLFLNSNMNIGKFCCGGANPAPLFFYVREGIETETRFLSPDLVKRQGRAYLECVIASKWCGCGVCGVCVVCVDGPR